LTYERVDLKRIVSWYDKEYATKLMCKIFIHVLPNLTKSLWVYGFLKIKGRNEGVEEKFSKKKMDEKGVEAIDVKNCATLDILLEKARDKKGRKNEYIPLY